MSFIKKNAQFINIGLIIIVVALMFFPCLGVSLYNSIQYKASFFQAVFGYSRENINILRVNPIGIGILVLLLINALLPLLDNRLKGYGYLVSSILGYFVTLLILLYPLIVNRVSNNSSFSFIALPILYVISVVSLVEANLCMYIRFTQVSE
ncbi:MAG: hypothetical protein PUA56_06090 [Bacillales bacterium]|nr:hypothetical protein [Bacillales bacterium]